LYPLLNSVGNEFEAFLNLPEFGDIEIVKNDKYFNIFKEKITQIENDFKKKYLTK